MNQFPIPPLQFVLFVITLRLITDDLLVNRPEVFFQSRFDIQQKLLLVFIYQFITVTGKLQNHH